MKSLYKDTLTVIALGIFSLSVSIRDASAGSMDPSEENQTLLRLAPVGNTAVDRKDDYMIGAGREFRAVTRQSRFQGESLGTYASMDGVDHISSSKRTSLDIEQSTHSKAPLRLNRVRNDDRKAVAVHAKESTLTVFSEKKFIDYAGWGPYPADYEPPVEITYNLKLDWSDWGYDEATEAGVCLKCDPLHGMKRGNLSDLEVTLAEADAEFGKYLLGTELKINAVEFIQELVDSGYTGGLVDWIGNEAIDAAEDEFREGVDFYQGRIDASINPLFGSLQRPRSYWASPRNFNRYTSLRLDFSAGADNPFDLPLAAKAKVTVGEVRSDLNGYTSYLMSGPNGVQGSRDRAPGVTLSFRIVPKAR